MKREKGMSLIVLTIIIIAIIIVGAVAVLLIAKGNNDDTNVGQVSPSTDTNYETEQNNDASNENSTMIAKFWIDDYKNWGEQKESFTLTLFDGKFTTPIDLKSADSFVKKYTYSVNKKNVDPTTSIVPIMNSEDLIGISGTRIWAYYGELNEYNSYKNSLTINVENYNGTDTALKECIANNWWYIEESVKTPERTLGIDMTNEPEYNKDGNAKPLLDKVVNELGAPKHIYVTERTSDGGLEIIEYLLSYEYDNYSVMIEVSESLYNNMHQTMVGSVTYYNNVCRDKRLEELKRHYELNPNSSIKFEIMK